MKLICSRAFAVFSVLVLLLGVQFLMTGTTVRADVSPPSAHLTVNAGGTATESKTVTVPALPPKADVEIAIDTTGSMGGAISQAQAQATQLVNTLHADIPDTNFSVVDFKDFVDGPQEYVVRQPNTNDASLVQNAINAMTAGGGGDYPEAQNLVLANATPDGPPLWRTNTRKFVVLITDAPPHGSGNSFPACPDTGADPHGLDTGTVVANLKAAQRTLFAIAAAPAVLDCYTQITAASYTGSAAVSLGTSIADQVESLIKAASSSVSDVHLEVVTPNPDASWISFNPVKAGPVSTPATLNFTVTISVPTGASPGDHNFDIVALADGADVGHQALTITVPVPNRPPDCSKVVASPNSLWPPNHKFQTVGLSGATDPDGDPVTITVKTVTQDEALNGLGDGDQAPDAQLVSGHSDQVMLRAERSGTGDGRVYRISFEASDGMATCSGTVSVAVPHDQAHPAVDTASVVVNSFGP